MTYIVKKDDLREKWTLMEVRRVLWRKQFVPANLWYSNYYHACAMANELNGGDFIADIKGEL